MKPSRQGKYRQVEEFLRILDASIAEAIAKGHLRPASEEPLRIVDLGCGNAYLTFAAHRFLTHVRGLPVRMTGVDVASSRGPTTPRWPSSSASRPTSWSAPSARAGRPGTRGRAGAARLRHRHRRRAGTGDRLGCPARAGRTLLPPRHRRPAAPQPHSGALRDADPTRHPARAVRRHPHRRRARLAAAAAGLSGRRHAVRRQRAHAAQHPAACRPHRPAGTGGAARQEYDDLVATWAVRPRLAELLLSDACLSPGRPGRAVPRRRADGRPGPAVGRRGDRLRGPRDRRVQRAGRRRRAVRDHQRLGRLRTGLRRRRRQRRDRRRDALVRRPVDVEALAPAGGERSGSATSATTAPPASRSASCACPWPRRRRRRPHVVRAGFPVVPATPSRCSPTRQAGGSTSSARASSAAPSTPPPDDCRRASPTGYRGRPGAGDRHRRGVLPRRPPHHRPRLLSAAVYSFPELSEVGRSGCRGSSRARASPWRPTTRSTPRRKGCTRRCSGSPCRPPYGGQWSRLSPTSTPTTTATPTATPPPGSREGRELPEQPPADRSPWGWALGGLVGLAILVVLVRALRPR